MKKLLMALILAVILTMTFATPAFAGSPPDAAKKGLERAILPDGGNDLTFGSMLQGLIAPWIYGHSAKGYAIGPTVAYYLIFDFLGN